MNTYGRNRLCWKNDELYFKKELMFTLIQHTSYSSMFWIQWPDGVLSHDFYNLTWAKQHCIRIALRKLNITTLDPDLST